MFRTVALAVLSVMICAVASAARANDEAAVIAMLHAACSAYRTGDATLLDRLLDERFTLTGSDGVVTSKAEELAAVRAREPQYSEFSNSEMVVRLYDGFALVTGITTIRGTAAGQPFAVRVQFTDTVVKRAGGWQLAASHASKRSDSR